MRHAWVLHVLNHGNHVTGHKRGAQDSPKTHHASHCKFVIKRNIYTKFA